MLELALHFEVGRPVQVRVIAERHGIPSQFLVQILQDLKRAGLVASVRGAGGGYLLTSAAQEITLAEVLDAVEASAEPTASAAPNSPLVPALLDVCHELSAARRHHLEGITLAKLVERACAGTGPMWYI